MFDEDPERLQEEGARTAPAAGGGGVAGCKVEERGHGEGGEEP